MNPVDSLPVIAEISLGLVGFTAVVAVLRRPDGGLGTVNLFRSLHGNVPTTVDFLEK